MELSSISSKNFLADHKNWWTKKNKFRTRHSLIEEIHKARELHNPLNDGHYAMNELDILETKYEWSGKTGICFHNTRF